MEEDNKNKKHKKWLLGKSGHRRKMEYSSSERFRHSKDRHEDPRVTDLEETPTRTSHRRQQWNKNDIGRLDTRPLKRYLGANVGRPWNDVHSEILERIPEKYSQYRDVVLRFVFPEVEIRPEGIFVANDPRYPDYNITQGKQGRGAFYIHPVTKTLERSLYIRKGQREFDDGE